MRGNSDTRRDLVNRFKFLIDEAFTSAQYQEEERERENAKHPYIEILTDLDHSAAKESDSLRELRARVALRYQTEEWFAAQVHRDFEEIAKRYEARLRSGNPPPSLSVQRMMLRAQLEVWLALASPE